MSVKRYTVTNATGWMTPWPTSLPATMVLASDFDTKSRECEAGKTALTFAKAAIEDAILSEDGLDGDTGSRVLHIIEEAVTLGTFDKVKYSELPKGMWERECERLRELLADCDTMLVGYSHLRATISEALGLGDESQDIVALIDRLRENAALKEPT